MRVCLFGTYEEDYPRNLTMLKGLSSCGFDIVHCHYSLWKGRIHKFGDVSTRRSEIGKAWLYLRAYIRISIKYLRAPRCDLIYISYPGQQDVIVARVLTLFKPAPIVFDAFLSLYDSFVNDRKIIKRGSLAAKFLFFLDKYACRLADAVILDTDAYIRYFVDEFGIPASKFRRIFIGADDTLFYPRKAKEEAPPFLVGFVGKFIPLHGLEYIVRAAKLLESEEDIRFIIVGEGQMKKSILSLVEEFGIRNISFKGWVSYGEIPAFLSSMDACLGIFGGTDKAARVIPNKVFEAMAVGKPVVTRKSPAAAELLVDGRDALLCDPADPGAIADAIKGLKEDGALRQAIARGGRKTFTATCGLENVSRQLRSIISEVVPEKEKERFRIDYESKKILIISVAGIGNTILFSPTWHALRKAFPKALLDMLVGDKASREIVQRDPDINDVSFIHKRWHFRSFRTNARVILKLRLMRYDVSLMAFPANRAAFNLLSFAIGARRRFVHRYPYGYLRSTGWLNKPRIPMGFGLHDIDQNLLLLQGIGLSRENTEKNLRVFLREEECEYAKAFVQQQKRESGPLIGIHPGGSIDQPWKRWPVERFAELMDWLHDRADAAFLVFIGPDEEDLLERMRELIAFEATFVTGEEIGKVAALLKRCDLLVTNDTGIMNLAVALGTKTLAIYGPSDDVRTGPCEGLHQIFSDSIHCRPCTHALHNIGRRFRCSQPYRRCLLDLNIGLVERKALEILNAQA